MIDVEAHDACTQSRMANAIAERRRMILGGNRLFGLFLSTQSMTSVQPQSTQSIQPIQFIQSMQAIQSVQAIRSIQAIQSIQSFSIYSIFGIGGIFGLFSPFSIFLLISLISLFSQSRSPPLVSRKHSAKNICYPLYPCPSIGGRIIQDP